MRRSDQRRDAVFALYQQDVTNRPLSALLVDAKPFTIELAEGTDEHVGEIDEVISEFAKGWDINRIAPLEKNIMRVALYEMNYRDDIPREVAIDEAVETAKNYSGTDAPGFVNDLARRPPRDGGRRPVSETTGSDRLEEIRDRLVAITTGLRDQDISDADAGKLAAEAAELTDEAARVAATAAESLEQK